MATIDRKDAGTERARFCPECGHPSGDANFCPACGHNMGFAADSTLADPTVQAPAGGRRPRVGLIVAFAALGVAAIAVAAIILLGGGSGTGGSSGSSGSSSYKLQLQKAVAPLISANQTLSSALTSLDGSQASIRTAKTDTAQALAALGAARGAVAVISAPASQSTLSAQVQQALTTDNGYLQAVSSTLASPNGPGTGQLQTLATAAQSALDPLNAVDASASTSVSGTDNLVSWAQGASGQAQKQSSPQHGATQATSTAPPQGSATTPPSSPPGLTACDQNISVNSSTSCSFANNVFAQYAIAVQQASGPLSTSVSAYSPATGATYTDSCQYNSSTQIVLCSHGSDLVQFPEWAAAVYNG